MPHISALLVGAEDSSREVSVVSESNLVNNAGLGPRLLDHACIYHLELELSIQQTLHVLDLITEVFSN